MSSGNHEGKSPTPYIKGDEAMAVQGIDQKHKHEI